MVSVSEDSASIVVRSPTGRDSIENNCARIIAFANQIATIHPLLAETAPFGSRSGYKNMMKQPHVQEMTPQQWDKLFKQSGEYNYDGEVDDLGHRLSLWNRKPNEAESFVFSIVCDRTWNDQNNALSLSKLPLPLVKPQLLNDIAQAAIEAFGGINAEIYTWITPAVKKEDGRVSYVWRFWQKTGIPIPSFIRVTPEQGPYSEDQAWLDGTLYTWSEYAPWTLLNIK
jgi:hypothetical protein